MLLERVNRQKVTLSTVSLFNSKDGFHLSVDGKLRCSQTEVSTTRPTSESKRFEDEKSAFYSTWGESHSLP